jgi:molecular chaperone DnaK
MLTAIGIDFGTTNSLCSWLDGDRPSIIPNARGSRSTPSIVAATAKGETLVGESAKNQAYINPENTISGVKRLLGSGSLLAMGGKSWRAEEIVALMLGSLKKDAERHLGQAIDRAVITAPAHFSDRERRAIAEAGRLSGLEVLRIVNEPTAAALARSWEAACRAGKDGASSFKKSLVLVYDFGGGTFDVTVLSREGADCRVLASRGDGRLGGADIDRELRRLAVSRFKAEGIDFESDRFLVQQLAEAAERAKIELSEREEASLSLAFATAGGRILHPSLELRRSDLEAIVLPYVERSLELVERALAEAGIAKGELDSLVLSGGSSRIPLVRSMLEERLGLKPEGGVNPEEIVALGAAVWASLVSGQGEAAERLRVRDVVSRTYGVEVDGGVFIPLIRKNSPVPSSYSRVFTTVADGQDSVEIHVLQGESRSASEDLSLGRFLLAGIKPAKAGKPRIKVDFSIDESDMLHVAAVDLETGAEQTISIADLGRGAPDESRADLARKVGILAGRLDELGEGLALERGLQAEMGDLRARARATLESGPPDDSLRMLKAELEGLVGELLARRAEARRDGLAARDGSLARGAGPVPGSRP